MTSDDTSVKGMLGNRLVASVSISPAHFKQVTIVLTRPCPACHKWNLSAGFNWEANDFIKCDECGHSILSAGMSKPRNWPFLASTWNDQKTWKSTTKA